jgi:hypothetical protein
MKFHIAVSVLSLLSCRASGDDDNKNNGNEGGGKEEESPLPLRNVKEEANYFIRTLKHQPTDGQNGQNQP